MYKGKRAVESNFKKYEAGPYKFKVTGSSLKEEYNCIYYTLKTWDADGNEGPTIKDILNIDGKASLLAETDRRLTTMLGKPEIEKPSELIGKTGWVILRKGAKYLEPMPWGGYYNSARKSATGNETMAKRIEESIQYDWTQDAYAVAKQASRQGSVSKKQDSGDEPF